MRNQYQISGDVWKVPVLGFGASRLRANLRSCLYLIGIVQKLAFRRGLGLSQSENQRYSHDERTVNYSERSATKSRNSDSVCIFPMSLKRWVVSLSFHGFQNAGWPGQRFFVVRAAKPRESLVRLNGAACAYIGKRVLPLNALPMRTLGPSGK